jgi:pimeloyl-ACP methyl ester carboxylesterase
MSTTTDRTDAEVSAPAMTTFATQPADRAVAVGGVDLWVHQRGAGPDVLLIGGLGDPYESWQGQLDGLAGRYRLTAPDNRGVGRTPMPAGDLSIRAMADDAAGALRELGIERAHVAGFSMGGLVAQELALAHPQSVSSLALLSSYARTDGLLHRTISSWIWLARVADDPREFLRAFSAWLFSRRAHDGDFAEAWVQAGLDDPHPMSTEDFCAAARACLEHDALDRLGAIAVPTLVVAGEEDLVTPPRFARELAERIPDAQLELLPAYAHQSFMEVPDRVNAVLDRFFSEVTA